MCYIGNMKEISLSQGKFALVDDADYEKISRFKWYTKRGQNTFYACRDYWDGRRHKVRMHRSILGLKKGDGKEVDHIDGNGLNNQKANLRPCTHSQNLQNRQKKSGCSSKYKGVYWNKRDKRWQAYIQGQYLGQFKVEVQAAVAYNLAAMQHFGDFARLNVVEVT